MGRDRQAFTADGEPITIHEHIWVMVSVTLHPGAESKRPVLGASVVWRCTKRNCKGLREQKYNFKRPRTNQNVNMFSAQTRSIIEA
jgi:hypothetical protein